MGAASQIEVRHSFRPSPTPVFMVQIPVSRPWLSFIVQGWPEIYSYSSYVVLHSSSSTSHALISLVWDAFSEVASWDHCCWDIKNLSISNHLLKQSHLVWTTEKLNIFSQLYLLYPLAMLFHQSFSTWLIIFHFTDFSTKIDTSCLLRLHEKQFPTSRAPVRNDRLRILASLRRDSSVERFEIRGEGCL